MVRCWRGLDEIPVGWGACVVTIGVFDGVHRGHQYVVGRAAERARESGLPAVAVTFDPRPVEVLAPEKAPPALTTVPERVGLLGELGVDAVLVLAFTREFSQLDPEDFIWTTLVDRLQARAVVVGEDFRFGHRAAGDVELLRKLGESWGFEVERAAAVVDEQGEPYSSTRVRERVGEGDVRAAARLLGRPHRLEGVVERGDGRGREMLGYPTANLACPASTAIPADGVYAGRLYHRVEGGSGGSGASGHARREETGYPAAISVGANPTFSGSVRRVEAYVLDREDLDLYDVRVALEFVERLRETLRFDSAAELADAMDRDVEAARLALGSAGR